MMLKNYRVRIQKEAVDELDQIYRHILADSPVNARSFLKQLRQKILSLKNFPNRGSRVRILEDSELEEVRFLEHKGYLIFYTVEDTQVIVLHLSSPGQNWIDFF